MVNHPPWYITDVNFRQHLNALAWPVSSIDLASFLLSCDSCEDRDVRWTGRIRRSCADLRECYFSFPCKIIFEQLIGE